MENDNYVIYEQSCYDEKRSKIGTEHLIEHLINGYDEDCSEDNNKQK